MTKSGPILEKIRVLDLGHYVAGPAAGMMLADHGADVIHIEPVDGPRWQNPADALLNRGKRISRKDLKNASDLREVLDLAESADIVIENFRPGVMDRLGLSYPALAPRNPGLIYLSLPGFASCDPMLKDQRAYEAIVSSATGQFTDMGLNRVLMGKSPSYSPLVLASAYAAVFGTMAVLLAIHARQKHGFGDHIEIPLASALAEALAFNTMSVSDLPVRYKSARELEIEKRGLLQPLVPMGYEQVQELLDPFHRTYQCSDNRPFYLVCGSHRLHGLRALEVLGIKDEMLAKGLPDVDPYLDASCWPPGVDCSVRAYPLSAFWRRTLVDAMKPVFMTRPAYEWENIFGKAGVPGSAHRTTKEWLHSNHARASGLVMEVSDPEFGPMLQPVTPAWVVGMSIAPRAGRIPVVGKINWAGARRTFPPAVDAEKQKRPWLEGVTILDLTNVIAGPTIAAALVRFGATVIKIDPVEPSFDPWNTIVFGFQTQRGKRSMLCDVKSPAGRRILANLISQADIITVNALERQVQDLGLGMSDLARRNPRAILCRLDAYGGPQAGPRDGQLGYDDTVQAATGIMSRFGGGMDTPEEHAHLGTIDVLGGLCGAVAASLALVRRNLTGEGGVARTSLAAAGQLIQIPFIYDYQGRPPFDEASGRDVLGEHALYHCYRAVDGWFFLAARPAQVSLLIRAGIPVTAGMSDPEIQKKLSEYFSTRTVDGLRDCLSKIGLAVQAMETIGGIRDCSVYDEGDLKISVESPTFVFTHSTRHPSGRSIKLVAPAAVRPKYSPVGLAGPAEKYGSSTHEILANLGLGQQDIERLQSQRVITASWSDRFLPE